MKETINNLLDKNVYKKQLEERRIDNINNVKRRLNEILDTNINQGKESFYISSGAFKTHDMFLLAGDILRKNGWQVQNLFSQKDGDSMYVSLHEIV